MKVLERIAERSTGQLIVLFGASLTFCATAALAGTMMLKDPVLPASERVFDTPMIVVAEQDGCGACESFRRGAGKQYSGSAQSDKMPLIYVQAFEGRAIKNYKLKSGISGTPTLLVIDRYGREVGRSVGDPGDVASVQKLADGYMRRASK
jgi:hypothetical protein